MFPQTFETPAPASVPLLTKRMRDFFAWMLVPVFGVAAGTAAEKSGTAWMDLEQLGKIQVITTSKRPEAAWTSGSALTVINREEISFGRADSLAATLRSVPGLNVAQIDENDWAVSARGFNAQFSNKLLVMVDGRSIYTPLFGGVLWNTPDTPVENLERVDVVRGPGGALWGANAVNGVIQFVTAPAADTPGLLAVAEAGTSVRRGLLRQGFAPAPGWDTRIHVQATERETLPPTTGGPDRDPQRKESFGFRADRTRPGAAQLAISGEVFSGRGGNIAGRAGSGSDHQGGHLLAKAENHDGAGTGSMLQAYFESAQFDEPILGERRQTFDGEFQHDRAWSGHLFSAGAGYRLSRATVTPGNGTFFDPSNDDTRIVNAFAQAEFALVPRRLNVTAGAKVESNNASDTELLPSLRAVWTDPADWVGWAAVSRAVRTPSLTERAARFDATVLPEGALGAGAPTTIVRWYGSPQLQPEEVVAIEAGWRKRFGESLAVDAAVFLNHYDRLVDIVPTATFLSAAQARAAHRVWRWDYVNGLKGLGFGAEAAASWHLGPRSQLRAGYSFVRVEQSGPPGGLNETYFETSAPRHSYFARADHGLGRDWSVHVEVRSVGALPAVNLGAYVAADARVAWRATRSLEVVLTGENLTDRRHPEFRDGSSLETTELPLMLSLRLTWRK